MSESSWERLQGSDLLTKSASPPFSRPIGSTLPPVPRHCSAVQEAQALAGFSGPGSELPSSLSFSMLLAGSEAVGDRSVAVAMNYACT